jgi:anti-anti-sigma factor
MSDIAITTKIINDFTLAVYPGERLDNNNAGEMVDIINQAHSDGYRFVIMDFESLNFISSAGVGAILGTIEIFRAADGDIIIFNVPPTIRHIFEVLDLIDYLTFRENEAKALEFVNK